MIRATLTAAFAALLMAPALAAAPVAGEVTMLTGGGTASTPKGEVRPLAKGGKVYPGESLHTGPNSYLNVKFTDGGLMLLRPNSRFEIERYSDGKAPATSAPAVPLPAAPAVEPKGPVIKQISTPTFGKQTFTVEGSGFDEGAKLVFIDVTHGKEYPASDPTAVSASSLSKPTNLGSDTAHWQVKVRNPDGTESWPYDFGVGMEVTPVPPPTAVAKVAPTPPPAQKPAAPAPTRQEPPSLAFRLLRGGFRTVTGLIGSSDRSQYQVKAGTATIGIRGTDYSVIICDAACALDPVVQQDLPPGKTAEGALLVAVTSGGVIVRDENGSEFRVEPGQFVLLLADGSFVVLPGPPKFLQTDPIPDPKDCD